MTKLVATADTHFRFDQDLEYRGVPLFPDGDIFILAGDFMYSGTEREWYKRVESLASLTKYKHKLLVPGNHDLFFQHYAGPCMQEMRKAGVHCLTPTGPKTEIDGIRFGGCPFVTNLPNWAYNADEDRIWQYLDSLGRVDVMIAHAPPKGVLDSDGRGNYGTQALRRYIAKYEPEIVICGHVHEEYGTKVIGRTHVYNVAMCDGNYTMANPAMVIEL